MFSDQWLVARLLIVSFLGIASSLALRAPNLSLEWETSEQAHLLDSSASCYASDVSAASLGNPEAPRHAVFVRVTHWITAICFFALLVTGAEIVISHPRFYWGETGNILTPTLFRIPIPASRRLVPTGYNYVMPDQNGWSRYLHFQAAWAVVITGILYAIWGLWTGHFRSNLFPAPADRTWRSFWEVIAKYVHLRRPDEAEAFSYNVMQRAAYLGVIFILFPLVILTGLSLSPAFNSAFPLIVNSLGGRQSARTLHFFISIALVLFLIVHVLMVVWAGFASRMRAMITGRTATTTTARTMIRSTRITATAAVPTQRPAEERL